MTLSNNKRITSASPRCVNNGCSSSSDGRGSLSLVCTKRRLILLALLFTLHLSLFSSASAQYTDNVGIGTATPDPSALLELRSTEKGFLITRMSLQQRDALQLPATGLMIYNTTAGSFQYNIGTPVAPIWVSMLYINIDGGSSSGVFWSLVGNDSVDATRNFLGTINDRPLIIKTDSVTRMIFQPTGEINMYAPTFISGSLDLTGDTTSLLMNGQAGAPGSPLVSRGPGLTPEWSVAMNIADTLTGYVDLDVDQSDGTGGVHRRNAFYRYGNVRSATAIPIVLRTYSYRRFQRPRSTSAAGLGRFAYASGVR